MFAPHTTGLWRRPAANGEFRWAGNRMTNKPCGRSGTATVETGLVQSGQSAAKPGRQARAAVRNKRHICLSVCLGDDRAPVHRLAGNNTFAGTVVVIRQRNASHRGLELFEPGITLRVVLYVRHYELAATLLGSYVVQDRFDLADRVGYDGISGYPLLRDCVKIRLH